MECNNSERGPIDITTSMVGNSLRGLYGRYAVAQLAEVLGNPTRISGELNKACYYYLLDGRNASTLMSFVPLHPPILAV